MNVIDHHRDEIDAVARQLPVADGVDLVFEAPWQARIFALIVALVKEGHLPWKDFQSHLVKAISDGQTTGECYAPSSSDSAYFQSWLEAVEETLKESDFMADKDLVEKIADLQSSTLKIREQQLRQDGVDR